MGDKIRKLKKIRLHREGTDTLVWGFIVIAAVALLLWRLDAKLWFWLFMAIFGTLYAIVVNFFRCPVRYFPLEDTEGIVVAPADGKVVVIEEVEETEYFHDRRLMISIFMSPFNVHANWFPVDGQVKSVKHQNGNFHKAWLPKASEENERADVLITTPDGVDVLCRQIAGAMARRIVTYAKEGEDCYIDEHLGFIKLGSRVDVYLPLGSEVLVKMGQKTVGDQTVIAKLARPQN
ncbi:MAG: phosphatidylserine decarboxylase family protein [Prevotella sp.]|nr:phosphatidylserine decarboxylase family protein [Prevotella sp.]